MTETTKPEAKPVQPPPGTFAYLGDFDSTELFGLTFARGEGVEVTDPKSAAKLRGNPDFSEVVDGVELVTPPPKPRPGPKAKAVKVPKVRHAAEESDE